MKDLTSLDDLDDVLGQSQQQPVMLFKHSTRCPRSAAADEQYRQFAAGNDDGNVLFTHLDLIAHRDVSNAIAKRTKVWHQSPQAILVVDGEAVWSATHEDITVDSLKAAVNEHTS